MDVLHEIGIDPEDVPARVREMYEYYATGVTLADVGGRFGVPAARVSERFHEAGLPLRPRAGEPTVAALRRREQRRHAATAREDARKQRHRERVNEMYAAYLAGASMAEVGRRFGITASRVSQLFAVSGIPARRGGPAPRQRAPDEAPSLGEVIASLRRARGPDPPRPIRAPEAGGGDQ